MSCGNRFQCGLTKSSRFQFKPDKPSNTELHNENQKRLNDLLKAREEIDKQFITSNTTVSEISSINVEQTTNSTYIPWTTNDTLNITPCKFTPWKVPSTSDYQSKLK